MSDIMETEVQHSAEFDLDRQIEERISTMVERELTPSEEADFIAMLTHRSNLMRPSIGRRTNGFSRLKMGFAA